MPNVFEVLASSINIMQVRIARSRLAGDPPDVIVAPQLAHVRMLDFHRAKEAIEEGHRAVERVADTLALLQQRTAVRCPNSRRSRRSKCRYKRLQEDSMKTITIQEAVGMIPNGACLMIGGFMACGTPEPLMDELVRQGKRDLTVIANDTAMPGVGIGKLVRAKLLRKVDCQSHRPQQRDPGANDRRPAGGGTCPAGHVD